MHRSAHSPAKRALGHKERLALLLGAFAVLSPTMPARAQSTLDIRVSAGSDDAEESTTGGSDLGSSDLELVQESTTQTVGIRFVGITVPPGATILASYVQFKVDETSSDVTSLTIEGQAEDNPPVFTSANFNVSSRPRTSASTVWSPVPWSTVGDSGPDQRTPDLSSIVQEIVDRPAWSSGSAIALLITGAGKRVAEAYDGDPPGAPLLHIEFAVQGNTPPSVSITAPASGWTFSDTELIVFSGSATDYQDGVLTSSLSWSSSLDGPIGFAGSFSTDALSLGSHIVTASVSDGGGLVGQAQIGITISDSVIPILVGAGDIADCSSSGDEQTAALLDSVPGTVFTLGDNAYQDASAAEFNNCYGPTWGRHKARTRPVSGNHEYQTSGAAGYFGYFGAAAGDPSEGYYSYNLGNWHVVVLNSECSFVGGCSSSSPQGSWLQGDLAANPSACTIAMWHRPRFSSSGGSSSFSDFWQILQQAGADVVLVGHRHNYERFAPQDWNGNADPTGIREFVVGTGGVGSSSFGSTAPNSQVRSQVFGVLKLTLNATSYAWEFIPVAGESFTDLGSAACVTQSTDTPPSVTVTAPAPGSIFNQGASVSFTGTATDAESGNLTTSLAWSSSIDGTLGTGASITTNALSVATHTITASVTDSGGTTGSLSLSVIINARPVVSITAPADGSAFNQGAPVTFTGSASDAEDGNLTTSLAWSSSIGGAFGTGGTVTTGVLSAGTHIITASAPDSRGFIGSASRTVTIVANASPVVTITAPVPGSIFNQGVLVIFTGSASDAESGDLTASLVWNSSINGGFGTGGTVDTSSLTPGTHTITASVTDSGGATGSASRTVVINARPVATITAPANGSSFGQGVLVTFTGSASDAEDGTLTASLVWSSSINEPLGTGGTVSTSSLSLGTHTITASATDSRGFTGSASRTVNIVANTAPTVTITAPASGSVFNQGALVTFTGTASDPESGNLTASLAWNSSLNGALGTGGTVSSSTLSPGTHTITASVTDSVGGSGSQSITVVINARPLVSITAPANGSSFNQGTLVTFTGSASDAEDGSLTASLVWSSSINGTLGTGGSVSTNSLSLGTHSVAASVADSRGLTGSATISITVTAPVVEVRIAAGANDAEERADGSVSTNNNDLEMVNNNEGGVTGNQTVGLRFTGVGIPPSVTIRAAWLQFQADETSTEATTLVIQGQAADNAAAFAGSNLNISTRPRTLASASWSPVGWTSVGQAGPGQRSVDISGLIQELVTRPGWASGNALALVLTGTGKRVAEPYEGTVAGAPLLHVEYDPFLLANAAPVVNAGPDQTLIYPTEAVLSGTVTDDGRPEPPGVTTAWGQISGPGVVTFFNLNSPATTASFSVPGSYVLRLTAQDGERSSFDELTVTANPAGLQVLSVRVNAGVNDAEERVNGTVNTVGNDLEMVNNTEGGVTGNQTVGLRFTGVSIPQNATIWSAWVQFQADETSSEATTLAIRGQAEDNALAFTSANLDISARPPTLASASWSPPAWSTVGQAGPNQRSADISALIHEIVTRPGWVSGNALALIITGTGKRVAEPFEGTVAGAPLLHVEYTPAN